MSQEIISRYMWIEEDRWGANCITFVKSSNEDEILRCFGGDLTTEKQMTLGEAIESRIFTGSHGNDCSFVLAGRIGEWIVTEEFYGYQGVRHEVWRRASQGTEMVIMSWDVDGRAEFIYAVEGKEVVAFDMDFPEERGGSDPDRLLDYMLELPFSAENRLASALALAERITGVRLEPNWIESKHRVVKVIPLPQEQYPEP
jgi:hypothetical protein